MQEFAQLIPLCWRSMAQAAHLCEGNKGIPLGCGFGLVAASVPVDCFDVAMKVKPRRFAGRSDSVAEPTNNAYGEQGVYTVDQSRSEVYNGQIGG